MKITNYNERSWAIDVISEINSIVGNGFNNIIKAGGERTVKNNTTSLFPDVILFGDSFSTKVIQGWELKMPDTSILDHQLFLNAAKKAEILNLNSFLLWNVNKAVLYVKNGNLKSFEIAKEWNLDRILKRGEVLENTTIWKELLRIIIGDLDTFFSDGIIKSRNSIEAFSSEKIINIIISNVNDSSNILKKAASSNPKIKSYIEDWWLNVESDHCSEKNDDKNLKYKIYTERNLLSWVNRVLFCHYLKTYYPVASRVSELSTINKIADSVNLFREIYLKCDFLNILNIGDYDIYLSDDSWGQIKELNSLLSEIEFENLDDSIRGNFLESINIISTQKLKGQFATPKNLARLLIEMCVDDKNGIIYDPCCGSGGIIKEIINIKKEFDIDPKDITNNVWASDKFSIPIQITTLLLSQKEFLGNVLNIFKGDLLEIEPNQEIKLINPNDGQEVIKKLPSLQYITSNLPFIRQELIKTFNKKLKNKIRGVSLDGKSDFFAYLPFVLWELLDVNGKLGIIVSNSWLGTGWGKTFRKSLMEFYNLDTVIISSNIRWFQNADVVSTIMILSKKSCGELSNEGTRFIKINTDLNSLSDMALGVLINSIILEKSCGDFLMLNRTKEDLKFFEENGLGWNCFFENLGWFKEVSKFLAPITKYLSVSRGERRGWNPLFYPDDTSLIDNDYLKPFVKNQKELVSLVGNASKLAFSCSLSKEDLEKQNKTKTLKWITKFSHGTNDKGIPLPKSLEMANHFWYEMKTDKRCDFVCGISPDRRLFITRFKDPTFVDQRLISMKKVCDNTDLPFIHAILNSILGLFYIEAIGFGRGLGVLDLSVSRFKDDFRILNIGLFTSDARQDILDLFEPLLNRPPYELESELESLDRVNFDKAVLRSLGLERNYKSIKETLLSLYKRRHAVR